MLTTRLTRPPRRTSRQVFVALLAKLESSAKVTMNQAYRLRWRHEFLAESDREAYQDRTKAVLARSQQYQEMFCQLDQRKEMEYCQLIHIAPDGTEHILDVAVPLSDAARRMAWHKSDLHVPLGKIVARRFEVADLRTTNA